jgi:hypothetical protein
VNAHLSKQYLDLIPISRFFDPFGPFFGLRHALRTHSSLQSLQYSLAHHPQVRQLKHYQQLAGVLGQSPIAHLAMTELALDYTKRMLDLSADAGLDLLQLVLERVDRFAFIHCLALARHHGNLPIDIGGVLGLHFFTLVDAPVARVGKDHIFLTMQKSCRMCDVVGIGRCGGDRGHQA